ncbi:SH3 domain-containing protein [Thermoleptolyngbya sichuanensis XZ-Cy5]|uniref:SH3 domain-containing protein n=1 Tax=Thermoleptolyngbya sichuanensis TaxID=2885951 RepID=UPI00240D5D4C|nr:SH3 domain-containing protein [Thermoleptolyngbya sichuanensis]MDG2617156.1 SH3 domain-containing protein [Thermoleptolyngbya sichuanensis XZ-Cy5]
MESLAYIHAAVAYEDPNPAPELQVSLEIPSSVWLGTLSTAVVVSAVGGVAPEAQAVVRFGDTCIQVGDVQSALASAGFSPGSVDSVFGSNTLSAVRRFQLSKGLSVDGVVGPATASSLGLSGSIYDVGVSCGTGGPGDDGGPDFVRVSTNGSPLTVRNGPGSGFAPIDYLSNGTVVRVVGSSGGWYNISGGGWISQAWTVESSGGSGGGGGGGGGTGNYFVSTNGGTLLVRNGPGTGFAVIDELFNGTSVTIVEVSGGWGRLSSGGWVSMDWLSAGGSGGGGGGGGGTGNYFVSTNGGTLLVRNGPGTGFAVIDELFNGTSVTIVEVSGGWGRLSGGGWVSMDWLSAGGSGGGGGGGGGTGNYFVSTNGGTLVVRSGPGPGFIDIDELPNGTPIDIVEFSGGWGRLASGGWVSMDWVAFE